MLRADFVLTTALVAAPWRRRGVGRALVDELLHRVPRGDGPDDAYRVWALAAPRDDAAAAFLARAGGEARSTLGELARSRPQVALALGLSGGAAMRGDNGRGLDAFCFAGQREARGRAHHDGRLARHPHC